MSIRSRQIAIQTERAIRKELLAGRFPELTAIQNAVSNYFMGKPAGLPRFEQVIFEEGEVSNPNDYNEMLYQIKEDLDTSFEEVEHQHKKLLAQEELNEKEKQRILLFLKEVEQKSRRIEQLLRYRKAHTVFTENFFDFKQIEFDPQEDKNIAGTTAFIDLKENKANIHQSQIGREKLFLGDAKTDIKLYTEHKERKTYGRESNAVQDSANNSWRMKLVNDKPIETKVGFIVELEKVEKISMIRLNAQSKSPLEIKLMLSEDGTEWKEEETYTVRNNAQWVFSPKKAKFVQFILTKSNHDSISGMDYEYWFGIQNVRFYRESFLDKAIITSKPFTVNEEWIDTIILKSSEELHPSTNIRYFVGEDREDFPIEWKEIVANEPFEMKMLDLEEELYRPGRVGYETAIAHPKFPSKMFYELGEAEHLPIAERTELRQGDRMWKVDHYQQGVDPTYTEETEYDSEGNPTGTIQVPTGYIPSLADWVGAVHKTTRFLHINDTITYDWIPLRNNHYTSFEMNFEATDTVSWSSKEIRMKGDMQFRIYVDNMLIEPISIRTENDYSVYTYSFYFKKGKHNMKIVCHSLLDGKLSFNFDFSDTKIEEVFGDSQSLRYAPWEEFVRYTSSREIHKFSIVNGKIVVPYKPSELDYKRDWELSNVIPYGVDYRFRYRYIEEKRDNIQLRIMSILERDPSMRELSPFLLEYSLIVQ